MNIRRVEDTDVRRLSYLIQKNIDHVKANHYSAIQQKTWRDQNTISKIKSRLTTRTTFCAIQHGKLVGTISIQGNLVCGMYVSYAKRGSGIGQQLLEFIEHYAKEKGLTELILTASPNGHGFYLKNGFEPYGPTVIDFNGIKFPETKMKKSLL